ncbi:MAG: MFS transporter, partial [Bryobacteraceae bacterium]
MDPLLSRTFVIACAMHFSGAMATSFYILFPLFIREIGGSELTIGVYAGLVGTAAVAARFPVGRFLDSHGRRWVLATAGVLNVVAWLGFRSFHAIGVQSAMLVMLYGAASGSLFATYFTYASDIIPASRRSEGFGLFGIWGMLPNGLAPKLGEWILGRSGFDTYFLVAASFAAVSLGLSLLLPETAEGHVVRISGVPPVVLRQPFPVRRLLPLLAVAFAFATGIESLFVFLAPFAYAIGRGSIGNFFLRYSLSAVLVRIVAGRLPDRVGLLRVLLPALFAYAVGLMLIPGFIDSNALLM